MPTVIELIRRRISIRAYSSEAVGPEARAAMTDFIQGITRGPFGSPLRFEFVEVSSDRGAELRRLGTYSMIRGAKLFLAGAVQGSERAMEDFGYCMEGVVLKATELRLGTCWLGGSLNRSSFAQRIALRPGEVIPAVTPIGYPGDKASLLVRALGNATGTRLRKEPDELFFEGEIGHRLDLGGIGDYALALECVRLAPSASNRQPWRIVKDPGRNAFHFYMKENIGYNTLFRGIRLQNVDMGIALAHFALSAHALSLDGRLTVRSDHPRAEGLRYIASWIED